MVAVTLPTPNKPQLGWQTWWPVLLGLAVLYLPTWWDLANTLWSTEEQSRGPVVLLIALYLIWQKRHSFLPSPASGGGVGGEGVILAQAGIQGKRTNSILGWSLLIFGLLLYALGRSQEILLFEVGSQIPVLLGVLLITLGGAVARTFWFPILFLGFMMPLPGFLVDTLTGPLKQFVSIAAENILYGIGYPVGRSGVTLTIGQYQLLVADACSGLHSIFSLSAMGVFYLYLMEHTSWLRNGILIASIVPIAVSANVVRVMLLILVTYYFGDAAGQGFAHGFAGIMLFVIALLFLVCAGLGCWVCSSNRRRKTKQ